MEYSKEKGWINVKETKRMRMAAVASPRADAKQHDPEAREYSSPLPLVPSQEEGGEPSPNLLPDAEEAADADPHQPAPASSLSTAREEACEHLKKKWSDLAKTRSHLREAHCPVIAHHEYYSLTSRAA